MRKPAAKVASDATAMLSVRTGRTPFLAYAYAASFAWICATASAGRRSAVASRAR